MAVSASHRAARRLILTFGLITAVVLAAVGFAMLSALGRQAAAHGQEDAIAHATGVAREALNPVLQSSDLDGSLPASRRRALDGVFRRAVLVDGVYKAKLFAADGRLVYSTHPGNRGDLKPEILATVLRTGEVGRMIDAPDVQGGKGIEAFVPVRGNGERRSHGVLQADLSYAPVAAAHAEQVKSVATVLLLGALAIMALLMTVFAFVSRRLRDAAARSEHLAHHDPLTGLANRRGFTEMLEACDRRSGTEAFAVAMIDVDGFKAVNDTLGHHHGDAVLKIVAERIGRVVRPGDAVARVGGDEFAVILRGTSQRPALESISERVSESMRSPIDIGGVPVLLGVSVGIAVSPGEPVGGDVLIEQADLAMYRAKNERTGVEFYTEAMGEAERESHRVAADLRRALADDELVVFYQPQAGFGGELTGVEALVRWQHPERGLIPPDRFISIAERTGLIRPLTFFVLQAALHESARLRRQGIDVTMAVNLSALLLQDRSLAGQVVDMLVQEGVPAHRLELEITESSLIDNVRRAGDVLNELASHGVRIAVDDWGTGYSSMQHLRNLPVSVLKIDRSLVSGLGENQQDRMLVESTIAMSRGLGLEVVAEGVETVAMWNMLAGLGCHTAQGYLLGKPMASGDLDLWLVRRAADDGDDYRLAA